VRESFTPNHPTLFYDAAVEMIFHKFSETGDGAFDESPILAKEHSCSISSPPRGRESRCRAEAAQRKARDFGPAGPWPTIE
jgi:hypothetical protein